MLNGVNPVYMKLCPKCGQSIEANELLINYSCSKCLSRDSCELNITSLNNVLDSEYSEFEKFFEKVTCSKPWGLQKAWIKKILRGESTVIAAPTGMGKTTLLTVYTLYMTRYGKKSIILVPTRALARQIHSRLANYSKYCSREVEIVYYDTSLSRRKREEVVQKIASSSYDILILTHSAFIKKENIIDKNKIDIIIVDDVDSFLKNNKNIYRLVKLMGFSEEVVDKINEKYKLLWRITLVRNSNNNEFLRNYLSKLIECESEIKKEVLRNSLKQVVISSATSRVKSSCSRVINELLSITISGLTIYGRNIRDTYLLIKSEQDYSRVAELIDKLGSGGLILISPHHPFRERLNTLINRLVDELREKKYRVEYADSKTIEKLISREVDLIIGSSSYYGVSIRGLDAPEVIKYVVFIGTPVYVTRLNNLLSNTYYIVRTLLFLYEYTGKTEFKYLASSVRNKIAKLSRNELKLITQLLCGKISISSTSSNRVIETYRELDSTRKQVVCEIESIMREKSVLEIDTLTIIKMKNDYYGVIPDIYTYIQGSGRTSRLYSNSLTRGLSIVVEFRELENIVKSLNRKLYFYTSRELFEEIDKVDLDSEKTLIEKTRKNTSSEERRLSFRNILVVVESPTKAKTIANFFGKPLRRRIGSVSIYEVPFIDNNEVVYLNIVATRGHIFDLSTNSSLPNYGVILEENIVKPVYDTIKKCRVCGYQFTHGDICPKCSSKSIVDSIEVINVLRKIAYEVDEVYIATDPDIEGEKIAYDTYLVIKPLNNKVWRIELHEITIREFLKAIRNKREICTKLVEAEIYRRVLDRLIGFSLSQELWRIYGKKYLSAGRVQTPVLGWIIERYNEYRLNKCWRIIYRLTDYSNIYLQVVIPHSNRELYSKLLSVDKAVLTRINTSIETVYPNPPYTTDQLIYDSVRNGLTTTTVMKIAQDLFESGLITYHRTDSVYVSSNGIDIARKYIEKNNLLEYFKPSHWSKPGVHEAIRPVYPLDRFELEKAVSEGLIPVSIVLTNNHYRVYDLVFRRFIASQMKPYRVVKYKYLVNLSEYYSYSTEYTVDIVENGFNLVNKHVVYRELLGKDEIVSRVEIVNKHVYSAKPLFSEGDIVLKMKREGLGRPSTYAKIINNIVNHKYVFKSKKKNLLIPTRTGLETYCFLTRNYSELVSIDTTRFMEKQIDYIINNVVDFKTAIGTVIDLFKKHSIDLTISSEKSAVLSTSS